MSKISYELYSDSDSTINDVEITPYETYLNVASTSKTTFSNCLSDINYKKCNNELESILQKYGVTTSNTKSHITPPVKALVSNTIELSSDEESPQLHLSTNTTSSDELHKDPYSLSFLGDQVKTIRKDYNEEAVCSISRKRKHGGNVDKDKRKEEKAVQKAQRQEAIAKAKRLKQVLRSVNKNMKPEEALKFIKIKIDGDIVKEQYGDEILNALRLIEVKYDIEAQLFPNVITWSCEVLSASTSEDDGFIEKMETVEADDVLAILNWDETIKLVHNKTLNSHVQSIKSILNKKKLFIVIYGLEDYFRYHKRQKRREVRNEVSHTISKTTNKNENVFKDVPIVSKQQFELALTELQILHMCSYRLIESCQDLGTLVTQFTKSIASAPYKLQKYQKEVQASWYMAGDNKDCVKVDKSGNGLKRLWQQQLTTFPLARLEHAEAVIAKYPTLKSLLEECNTSNDREKILQDIPIRRAAGPMTTFRRLGIEFSKKVYKFFSSTSGDLIL